MSLSFNLDSYVDWIEKEAQSGSSRFDLFSVDYVKSHQIRYAKTIDLIDRCQASSALEVGATDFFQIYLAAARGINNTWATIFSNNIENKYYRKSFYAAGYEANSQVVSINLENELLPIGEENFDLILFCEVIEHLDIDPMFCLIELNRVMQSGGKLIVTTPNSCSARIAYKACLGYRPHFYMQYEKDRSPYRHNFEHDVRSLTQLLEAAGFSIEHLETHDVFEPTLPEAVNFLRRNQMPLENRGDDIFVLAKKVGPPCDRWPVELYV